MRVESQVVGTAVGSCARGTWLGRTKGRQMFAKLDRWENMGNQPVRRLNEILKCGGIWPYLECWWLNEICEFPMLRILHAYVEIYLAYCGCAFAKFAFALLKVVCFGSRYTDLGGIMGPDSQIASSVVCFCFFLLQR